jgi:hypothetical protein
MNKTMKALRETVLAGRRNQDTYYSGMGGYRWGRHGQGHDRCPEAL